MEHSKARVWVTHVYSGTMNDCGSSFPLLMAIMKKGIIDLSVDWYWDRTILGTEPVYMPFPKKEKRNLSPGMNFGGCLLGYNSGAESYVTMRSKTRSASFYISISFLLFTLLCVRIFSITDWGIHALKSFLLTSHLLTKRIWRLVTFSSNPLILSDISVIEEEAELRVPEESSGEAWINILNILRFV